jgi:hypothetical protein
MYLVELIREIATGTPLSVPTPTAPPIFANSGIDLRSTDNRPPGSFFTPELAATESGIPPSAMTAQAPVKRVLRVIGSTAFDLST